MGSSSSKFRKHLQNGDEYAALQLYYSNSDLRKGLDPNSSYGDTYNHDTPLHYASRHAMKSLLRVFLNELGGNPNKRNGRNETALLCVCMVPSARLNYAIQQRRLECLSLVLQWRGATLENGEVERVDLSAQDEQLNTALHYAAASGLKRCVELLISQNSPMFTENQQKETPCDCAERSGHSEIALYLESKMVFHNEDENTDALDNLLDEMGAEEGYSGLRAQDLQEAKDQLLVETSDMLHVPLFTAEALLRNHEWSREQLLEAWMEDAVACCEKCGVVPPSTLYTDRTLSYRQRTGVVRGTADISLEHDLRTPTHTAPPGSQDSICDICACQISLSEEPVLMLCSHAFCRSCWERYLTVKIKEGEAHNITCPGFDCHKLVPAEIIETLVSRDMARRYLQFDIKAFVESNPHIKWCPYPGCGRAVKLPDSDNPLSPTFRGLGGDTNAQKDTSHSVDCGNGHMFCWECIGEAHEPASCDDWTAWHKKIAEIKPEQMNGTEEETEMAANCLWLVTNSKPCPNCKSPIQKNEGCNHMKCSKCKHDFCWVCQEAWKKHSSATGGYFRCNRYEVVKRIEDGHDSQKTQAESKNRKMQELNRFVHYYTRFKNHENSFKLEEPLLSTAKDKMLVLARAVTDPETAELETKFVEDAVVQILKARRVLKCSYVYGYYLDETGYKKPIFEFMQTELEECTETLSEMVARPYLRTPRTKIIQTAHLVQRKRQEFVTAIAKGLVPPDSSPTMKRKRKKFNVEVDDDLRKALLASLQDLDPANPWIKDPSGKHTNVSALLDWPEESDDSDTDTAPAPLAVRDRGASQGAVAQGPSAQEPGPVAQGVGPLAQGAGPSDIEEEMDLALAAGSEELEEPGVCERSGCHRTRVVNPRTGELHAHCCMKCMRLDRMERQHTGNNQAESSAPAPSAEFFTDYQMDLLRALEMSRLQFLQEMGSLRPGNDDRSPHSPLPAATTSDPHSFAFDRSPRGASPLPRSPHLTTAPPEPAVRRESPRPPGDMEILTLCDPPRGRNRGQASPRPVKKEDDPLLGDFDGELERALRISQISVREDDQDLRLAIELSLQHPPLSATTTSSAGPLPLAPGPHSPRPPLKQHSPPCPATPNRGASPCPPLSAPPCLEDGATPLPAEYSSIVTRVPNKSIEDLASVESVDMLHPNYPSRGRLSPRQFGVIKDVSVTNLVAVETDKVRGFLDKDLSRAKQSCSASRLPLPARLPGASYTFDSGEDPWQLRSTEKAATPPPPPPPATTERLDHALQNLSDLTRNLTRPATDSEGAARATEDDDDHSMMVIDSKVLESLLAGAEGYGGEETSADGTNPATDTHTATTTTDRELERILDTAPPVPRDRLPTQDDADRSNRERLRSAPLLADNHSTRIERRRSEGRNRSEYLLSRTERRKSEDRSRNRSEVGLLSRTERRRSEDRYSGDRIMTGSLQAEDLPGEHAPLVMRTGSDDEDDDDSDRDAVYV